MLPFSEILKTEITDQGIQLSEVCSLINDDTITAKRLSEYQNGFHSPPFEKARKILDALGYEMSEDDLKESLKENREICRQNKEYSSDRYKVISLRIRFTKLLPGKQPEEVERLLRNRIFDLYGDETRISNYLHDLISKDLDEFILEETKE